MKHLFTMLLLCSIMVSCSKNNNDTSNNNPTGTRIYKGILIGSFDQSAIRHDAGAVLIKLLPTGTARVYGNFIDGANDSTDVSYTTTGNMQQLTAIIGKDLYAINIAFSTGFDGNSPTISGNAIIHPNNFLKGIVALETNVQPIKAFITLGSTYDHNVHFGFIQYGNTMQGFEASDINGVSQSITTGQFINSSSIAATGQFKYTGTFNNADSTITGTCSNVSGNTTSGQWWGYRIY